MPCKPNHYTTSEFLKVFTARTKQPEGTQVTVLKILSPFTGEFEYLTYKGDVRKIHEKKGPVFLFEVQKSSWKVIDEDIEEENDGARERGAASGKIINIKLPETLTEKDRELIIEQCENQKATSKGQIEGFANAYVIAKSYAREHIMEGSENWDFLPVTERNKKFWFVSGSEFLKLIHNLAEHIEPRNKKGYRKTPASFVNGNVALPADQIERAMESFAQAYAENRLAPDEAYEEFEKIHPFEDGNGRVGDLLWKMAVVRETGKWPETLPPDVFGEKSVLEKYKRKKEPQEGQFVSMAQKRRYEYLKSQK